MEVIKRNGRREPIHFDKITSRIRYMCYGLDTNYIDASRIAQQVIQGIYDGVTTEQLDELTSEICGSLIAEHPDYNKLAARICMSNLHKKTDKSFSKTMTKLYNNVDIHGEHSPLISKELFQIIQENRDKIDSVMIYDRDYLFDYFGVKTLCRSYLSKINKQIVERPQHLWMRVSLGLHGSDLESAFETYELLSEHWFTHASPTLFNAGTCRPQNSSCFLVATEDNIEGLFHTISNIGQISKWAGGIGLHVSNVRAKNSLIRGTNGQSQGLVPMMRVLNDTARWIDQGGRRNGSIAVYLEPWHADILDFLVLKENTGTETERARDLFYALWIPDLFMKRLEEKGKWSLMCPNECPGLPDVYGEEFEKLYEKYEEEGRYRKQIDVEDLWRLVTKSQIETGGPYLLFKDHVNKKSNQKNLGTIKSSNLCVAPETKILTDKGWYEIQELENQEVNVWNGEEFSETTVRKTGTNQELLKLTFSNGTILECTPYHKFYVHTGTRYHKKIEKVEAKDLTSEMKLIKCKFPVIDKGTNPIPFLYPYTHGLFCVEGTYTHKSTNIRQCKFKSLEDKRYCKKHINYELNEDDTNVEQCQAMVGKGHPMLFLYSEKKELLKHLEDGVVNNVTESSNRLNCSLNWNLLPKFQVPLNYDLNTKLRWLEGLCDGDGTIARNGNAQSLQICSIHYDFLTEVMYLLQTLGCNPKINKSRDATQYLLPDGRDGMVYYNVKTCYRVLVCSNDIQKLLGLGFEPKRLNILNNKPQREAIHFIKLVSKEYTHRISDTFCFNEPKKHMGIFNGILIGNCCEITEYSDSSEYGVCNLASISLSKFIDSDNLFNFRKLEYITSVITKNLNKIIDNNYYPTPETKKSNMKHRPIGIGIQGMADLFAMLKYPFTSDKAKKMNRDIFETIYYAALKTSCELAQKDGAYETFVNSPTSNGLLQFDLWDYDPGQDRYNWNKLKEDIKVYGLRNSLLLAPMPTASTAQILGNNESFEPFTSNIYTRSTLAGNFIVINKHLVCHLLQLGLWNTEMKNKIIYHKGSIQEIEEIPSNVREIYKTVWEIRQKEIMNMSADRGVFICQSQSLNIHLPTPTYAQLTSMIFHGWRLGLKTSCYYLRSKPAADPIQVTLDVDLINKFKKKKSKTEEQLACSRNNPESCEMCSG